MSTAKDRTPRTVVGTVRQVVRYPVKSMRGESLDQAGLTSSGLEGDRLFAFQSEAAPAGMLRLSGRERRELLRFTAHQISAGVLVRTPAGQLFPVDDPALIEEFPGFSRTWLTHAPEPQTDCRPLSLISLQTIDRLSAEVGIPLDPRRFRANLYLDMNAPFAEDSMVGHILRIGPTAKIQVTERDPRCRFIILDPETIEPSPQIMTILHRYHQGRAGVYASILASGSVRQGDSIYIDHPKR